MKPKLRRNIFGVFLAVPVLCGLAANVSFASEAASDEDLEEASGLMPEVNSRPLAQDPVNHDITAPGTDSSSFRFRGYFVVDWRLRETLRPQRRENFGPNAELSIATDYAWHDMASVFLEGRVGYDDEKNDRNGFLDQVGLRLRPVDAVVMVLGKERNRRSPAIIVSPSDFIHSQQNAPGLREERAGVWLARAAWQTQDQSVDVMALPFQSETELGFPDEKSGYHGTVARFFRRLPLNVDLGLDVGRFDGVNRYGAFMQGIVADIHKIYFEVGHSDYADKSETKSKDASHYLVGWSYEGSNDYSLKLEYYQRDKKWIPTSPLFTSEEYLIGSLGLIEFWNRFNINNTVITSLDSDSYAAILRGEWLATDRQVVGVSFVRLEPSKLFSWQATADWKISF